MKTAGIALLVLGIIFLLVDLGKWDFWGIQWWTALIIFAGLMKIGCSHCKACDMKKKK